MIIEYIRFLNQKINSSNFADHIIKKYQRGSSQKINICIKNNPQKAHRNIQKKRIKLS
jgi:hypothetical protein